MPVPPRATMPIVLQANAEQSLYEVHQKIYPRAVSGWFATWRWALVAFTQLVYYGTPWLTWNDRQAVLFDLGARKFYIFGLVFWPQDFIYLALLLVISAYSLFLFTTVAGRLWCGYTCPQTVYTEIFLWIERVIEGDRNARMRLDRSDASRQKVIRKALKHTAWIALSLWTGFTFVGYFTPIHTLSAEVISRTLGPWELFWLLFYGFATYGNAGWLREQVCKYMCPYARFQGVMFDRDTLVIAYDEQRGEPRGSRSRKADAKAMGLGACVDCEICVQVCPTGIDIRKGQQYECIGCAACIDGCDQVMDKMGYERGLIRYASANGLSQKLQWRQMVQRVFRPRVLIYTIILWTVIIATGISILNRPSIKVDVIRDRNFLSREVEGGEFENVYRLQLMNTEERARHIQIAASGIEGLRVVGIVQPVLLPAASTQMHTIKLRAMGENAQKGANRIHIRVAEIQSSPSPVAPVVIDEKSIFYK